MAKQNYNFISSPNNAIYAWTKGVYVENQAIEQARNCASLPFIYKHIALMPDVHWGMGATVGSVIPTVTAIIPAAVGVDIGCGMCAVKTSLTANDLPDNLAPVRDEIEQAVPVGFHDFGDDVPKIAETVWYGGFKNRYDILQHKYKAVSTKKTPARQLGTLGGGNHFIEVCLDENDDVWIMLHSGSRGVGNRIGQFFIAEAKRDMERLFINLPDKNLAYVVEGSEIFDDYVNAVQWAQEYARTNRDLMMRQVLTAVAKSLGRDDISSEQVAVNCHHNYIEKENHFGRNVWITRKGAVRARKGDLGIIPGSMGAKSFIVSGLGNEDSFHSCSHGAGRIMSRTAAKKRFTLKDHAAATEGVECRKDAGVLDETPAAYKDIDAVMAAQSDLVKIVHTLKQVVCVKG